MTNTTIHRGDLVRVTKGPHKGIEFCVTAFDDPRVAGRPIYGHSVNDTIFVEDCEFISRPEWR